MRARRALAPLLTIVLLTLLQCLQPLLHAHPLVVDADQGTATVAGQGQVHLPDAAAFEVTHRCPGPLTATVVAQDDLRRTCASVQARPVLVPERRLPGTGDTHDPPPASQSRPIPDSPFRIIRPPRGPPALS
ncbi:MAG TPA: hypothetical protein PK359_04330 [Burkholderiaceae bacterium]|jgi:hypothetical protein|nr:hypothetical protein [Burkholderiaceae bacterium]